MYEVALWLFAALSVFIPWFALGFLTNLFADLLSRGFGSSSGRLLTILGANAGVVLVVWANLDSFSFGEKNVAENAFQMGVTLGGAAFWIWHLSRESQKPPAKPGA